MGAEREGSRYITLAGGDKVYFDNIGAVAGHRFRFSARHVADNLNAVSKAVAVINHE